MREEETERDKPLSSTEGCMHVLLKSSNFFLSFSAFRALSRAGGATLFSNGFWGKRFESCTEL